jgi:hypothetical protein
MNAHVPPPRRPLRPEEEAEVVKIVADALREARQLETEKLRFSVHRLKLVCDGLQELHREQLAQRVALFEAHLAELVASLDAAVQRKSPRSQGG